MERGYLLINQKPPKTMFFIEAEIQEQFKGLKKPERMKVVLPMISYFNKTDRYLKEVLLGKRQVDSPATLEMLQMKYKEVFSNVFNAA